MIFVDQSIDISAELPVELGIPAQRKRTSWMPWASGGVWFFEKRSYLDINPCQYLGNNHTETHLSNHLSNHLSTHTYISTHIYIYIQIYIYTYIYLYIYICVYIIIHQCYVLPQLFIAYLWFPIFSTAIMPFASAKCQKSHSRRRSAWHLGLT